MHCNLKAAVPDVVPVIRFNYDVSNAPKQAYEILAEFHRREKSEI